MPKFEESPHYENFIENLTAQLSAWKASSEPADAFARRVTGLMRTEDKAWRQAEAKAEKRGNAGPRKS